MIIYNNIKAISFILTYLSAAVVLMHRLMMSFISVSVTFSNASGRIPYNI